MKFKIGDKVRLISEDTIKIVLPPHIEDSRISCTPLDRDYGPEKGNIYEIIGFIEEGVAVIKKISNTHWLITNCMTISCEDIKEI